MLLILTQVLLGADANSLYLTAMECSCGILERKYRNCLVCGHLPTMHCGSALHHAYQHCSPYLGHSCWRLVSVVLVLSSSYSAEFCFWQSAVEVTASEIKTNFQSKEKPSYINFKSSSIDASTEYWKYSGRSRYEIKNCGWELSKSQSK